MELSELSSCQEAELFSSSLEEWQEGPQVLTYGAILICRKGRAVLNVNYKVWELYKGAVITVFPNDVVELKQVKEMKNDWEFEILKLAVGTNRLFLLARRPMPPRHTCSDQHHQPYVLFAESIFQPAGVYLHLAVGAMPVEGFFHRLPRILAT